MRVAPYQIWVYRMNRWDQTTTDELVPGDICLIKRTKGKKKQTVPCDLLILSGSCVVNEAILTGESQPLVKESIAQLDDGEALLDINGEHKSNVLNSGTEIL